MAGVWETSAFVLRTLGAKNGRVLPFYIISSLTFMLAPLSKSSVSLTQEMYGCEQVTDRRLLRDQRICLYGRRSHRPLFSSRPTSLPHQSLLYDEALCRC